MRGFRNKQNFINAIYFHCGGLDLARQPLNSRKRLNALRHAFISAFLFFSVSLCLCGEIVVVG
jgi:hypothetical protein